MQELDKKRFLFQAIRLLEAIDESIRGDQPVGIDSFDLQVVAKHLREMIDNVQKDTLPPKERRFAILASLIVDQWPLGTKLGTEIISLEKLYQLL